MYTQQSLDFIPEIVHLKVPQKHLKGFKKSRTMNTEIHESLPLVTHLNQINNWDFDSFKLLKFTKNPTFEIGRYIFDMLDLCSVFDIENQTLNRFLTAVEDGYSKENYYHNSLHAADVAVSVVFLARNSLD